MCRLAPIYTETQQILQASQGRRPRTRLTEWRCHFGAHIARLAQLDKCLRGVSDVQARHSCCSRGRRRVRLLPKGRGCTESNAELARGASEFIEHVGGELREADG